MTASPLQGVSWPMGRLAEAMTALARHAGLPINASNLQGIQQTVLDADTDDHARLIDWVGASFGLEPEAVRVTPSTVLSVLRGSGPAILRFHDGTAFRMLLVTGVRRKTSLLLAPDLRVRAFPIAFVVDALCAPHEASLRRELDNLLEIAGVSSRRSDHVRSLIARQRLGQTDIATAWHLRLPPSAPFGSLLREAGVVRRLAVMLAVFAALYAIEILGWGMIGAAALDGRLDRGWLSAWVLLVMSAIPFQLIARSVDARLALDVSSLIKTRLLVGALRFDVDAMRRSGAGQLLGRVLESQAFESLALNSGVGSAVAALQLLFAAWVLNRGAAPGLHLVLLVVWIVVSATVAAAYYRRLASWTGVRLSLTHALIERMVGHQTTVAQEWPERRDAEQDAALSRYVRTSEQLDAAAVPLLLGVPSGWMVVGLLGLAPAFVRGGMDPAALAISLGGVLMAGRAFLAFAGGLSGAAGAAVAWAQIGPLFTAAGAAGRSSPFAHTRDIRAAEQRRTVPLMELTDVSFRYDGRDQPALRGATLAIRHGDRLLLQGPSGGGKSTLASLLVGLREPETGSLAVNGLDRPTLGNAWQQIVTSAPQFHENHLLSGSLAFNLLMGRAWPASEEDLTEATALCDDLGLGDLLERMPAGIMQQVGETGWQLSHGERSRVFLARALLQKAELTVLDESLAALDPESLETCLATIMRRSRTLAVVAHP